MDYCDGIMYSIKNGDTLYSISMKYKVPLALLLRANPYVDVYNLQVGETICIPIRRQKPQKPCWYPKGCCAEMNEKPHKDMGGEQNEQREEILEETFENEETDQGFEEESIEEIVDENVDERADNPLMEKAYAQEDSDDRDRFVQWERYVTKPGDTLEAVAGRLDPDKEDAVEDFIEKNGADRIYLLPGISYYTRK